MLLRYGHVKRMPEERIPKLIMDRIPRERRKGGSPRKTWMEGVQVAMTTRNLEPDQWKNKEEWRLVSGRRRQLLKKTGQLDRLYYCGILLPVQTSTVAFDPLWILPCEYIEL